MSAAKQGDGVLVGSAALAAFAAGIVAVSQHADCTSAGYRLAVADRENVELRRGVEQAERRVEALRTPQAATARAAAMKLASLKYPKTWNVVCAASVEHAAAPPVLPAIMTPPAATSPDVPMIPVGMKGVVR